MLIQTQAITNTLSGITGTVSTPLIDLDTNGGPKTISAQANITVGTPAAKTFASTAVVIATDKVTVTAHGYSTGLKGQLTTDGTLPTGLTTSTDYFIIVVDANTIQFASSLANALAGTSIDLTGQGSGNDTFTPTALAGATVVWQFSNDGVNFVNSASPTSVTTSTTYFVSQVDPAYRYAKLTFTLTAGVLTSTNYILIRGNQN